MKTWMGEMTQKLNDTWPFNKYEWKESPELGEHPEMSIKGWKGGYLSLVFLCIEHYDENSLCQYEFDYIVVTHDGYTEIQDFYFQDAFAYTVLPEPADSYMKELKDIPDMVKELNSASPQLV